MDNMTKEMEKLKKDIDDLVHSRVDPCDICTGQGCKNHKYARQVCIESNFDEWDWQKP